MQGTFEVIDDKTKLTFTVTADTQLVISVVGDMANYLFNRGYGNHGTEEAPIAFDDLTNQQKLDLVADHLQRVTLNMANSFKSNQAQEVARAEAEANAYQF